MAMHIPLFYYTTAGTVMRQEIFSYSGTQVVHSTPEILRWRYSLKRATTLTNKGVIQDEVGVNSIEH